MRPLKRRELVRKLRRLGFTGPTQEGKHPYMERGSQTLAIPGEHRRDIPVSLQMRILKQAGLTKEDWENA